MMLPFSLKRIAEAPPGMDSLLEAYTQPPSGWAKQAPPSGFVCQV